jgi:hypothetical protein
MLFLVDGIWGGELPVTEPVKWQITPFNNDWPNSIFVSQDHVAIESVGLDFVRAQFDEYADMEGADDYLHQAADSANWAADIIYDPENDGEIIESMGVHEHWNNDIDKQYTRDLGTGDGIELLRYLITGINESSLEQINVRTYPNPFISRVTFEYDLRAESTVVLEVFSMDGKLLASQSAWQSFGKNKLLWDATVLAPGLYIYHIRGNDFETRGKILKSGN